MDKKTLLDNLWNQDEPVWPWLWDLQINRDFYSLGISAVLSLASLKQRGQKILSGHHSYEDEGSDLDLDQVTWSSKVNIYSLGAATIPSFYNSKANGSKILSRHHLVLRLTDRPFQRRVGQKKNVPCLESDSL